MLTESAPRARPCSDHTTHTPEGWTVITPLLHGEAKAQKVRCQLAQSHMAWGRMGSDQRVWLRSLSRSGTFYADPLRSHPKRF